MLVFPAGYLPKKKLEGYNLGIDMPAFKFVESVIYLFGYHRGDV